MQFANDKDKLRDLAHLMNEQSVTPMMVTDDLLYVIDAALLPEEVEFLLEMGGGRLSRRQVEDLAQKWFAKPGRRETG